MYYFYPDGHSCCEGSTTKCPNTPCEPCTTNCTPLYCYTIPPYPTLYNTVLVTDINANPVFDVDLGECLHIPYQMGTEPPTDTYVGIPDLQTYPESIFQPGSSFDCNPNNCDDDPYNPDCSCYPEEDFKWKGQESVEMSFYWADHMNGGHFLDHTSTLTWVNELCGYHFEGWGESLYYTEITGWVLDTGQTSWFPYQDPNNNIFTYLSRDPSVDDYYEIS